jgi:transposase
MGKATREEWAKRVERWQDSGLTAKEFAAELDVAPSSLTFWKWKLRRLETSDGDAGSSRGRRKRRAAKHEAASTSFLQLVPTTSPQTHADALEVVLSNGTVIRVSRDFDKPTLVRLVAVLGGR